MQLAWQRLQGRDGHAAAMALLATLYRQETGRELPQIRRTPQGKPYFSDSDLHFSISHTREHVFCCLSRKNVGIDAEEADRCIDLHLAEKILSAPEKERYAASPDPRQTLLRFWVLKESYAKLLGKGLGDYLWHTDLDPEGPQIQMIDGCYVAVMSE